MASWSATLGLANGDALADTSLLGQRRAGVDAPFVAVHWSARAPANLAGVELLVATPLEDVQEAVNNNRVGCAAPWALALRAGADATTTRITFITPPVAPWCSH